MPHIAKQENWQKGGELLWFIKFAKVFSPPKFFTVWYMLTFWNMLPLLISSFCYRVWRYQHTLFFSKVLLVTHDKAHAIVPWVLMVKECKVSIWITIQVLTQCHVLRQVFTNCYTLNACDSMEENRILQEKLRTSATLPLSCTIKISLLICAHDNHSIVLLHNQLL